MEEGRYKLQIITYDSKNSQAAEVSAVNKLVYEDKVKYIVANGANYLSAWIKITEAQKVIVLGGDRIGTSLTPDKHYFFDPENVNPEIPSKIGWYCKTYPDKVKNVVIACVDNMIGRLISDQSSKIFQSFGVTPTVVFFPSGTTDMSALGTKIASLKPGTILVFGLSATADALVYQAVYQDGYRGAQYFSPQDYSVDSLLSVVSPDVVEGFITGMTSVETDPALTKTAQHFKDLWIASYGKWTNPQVNVADYTCLIAGLQKAGTLDTDKFASVIGNGLAWSDVKGDCRMIPRPDLGNDRTVDSIRTYYLKQVHNGKVEYLATMDISEATSYFQKVYPPLAPGATFVPPAPPPGGPPPDGPPSGGPPPDGLPPQ